MNRTEKSAVIERLRTSLDGVPSIVVTDFKGLTVEQTNELRSRFRKAEVCYEVVKNTLFREAVSDTSKSVMGPLLKGNTAIAYHHDDPTVPARIAREYRKENDKLSIKGGWLDGRLLDEKGVEALATLPGRDELRARMLSVLVGVPTKFVRTLVAGPQTFLMVLQARKQQLES